MASITKNIPATTYTIKEFIAAGQSDDMTYRNFSILEKVDGIEHVDHNLIYDYLDELLSISNVYSLTDQDLLKYQYAPDLLAYRVYGSTQLDFVIMALNDIMDPKDFSLKSKTVRLVPASILKRFLSMVYNAEQEYLQKNRSEIKK